MRFCQTWQLREDRGRSWRWGSVSSHNYYTVRVQELCECGCGCPGFPAPNSPYVKQHWRRWVEEGLVRFCQTWQLREDRGRSWRWGSVSSHNYYTVRVQELCECGCGCPGFPAPNSPYVKQHWRRWVEEGLVRFCQTWQLREDRGRSWRWGSVSSLCVAFPASWILQAMTRSTPPVPPWAATYRKCESWGWCGGGGVRGGGDGDTEEQ